jgi:predicted transcriptional regulator
MPPLSTRVQVLLTDEQYKALQALAQARRRPLSVLLRETVVDHLLGEARREAKQRAVEEIAGMDLPVSDWEEMEEEIIRAHWVVRGRA